MFPYRVLIIHICIHASVYPFFSISPILLCNGNTPSPILVYNNKTHPQTFPFSLYHLSFSLLSLSLPSNLKLTVRSWTEKTK